MIENKFKYFKLTRAPVRRIFLKHMRNTFHLSLSLLFGYSRLTTRRKLELVVIIWPWHE